MPGLSSFLMADEDKPDGSKKGVKDEKQEEKEKKEKKEDEKKDEKVDSGKDKKEDKKGDAEKEGEDKKAECLKKDEKKGSKEDKKEEKKSGKEKKDEKKSGKDEEIKEEKGKADDKQTDEKGEKNEEKDDKEEKKDNSKGGEAAKGEEKEKEEIMPEGEKKEKKPEEAAAEKDKDKEMEKPVAAAAPAAAVPAAEPARKPAVTASAMRTVARPSKMQGLSQLQKPKGKFASMMRKLGSKMKKFACFRYLFGRRGDVQEEEEEEESRAAAGGDSNYCQGVGAKLEEYLPFHLNSTKNRDGVCKADYSAESYGFPLTHNSHSPSTPQNQQFDGNSIYVYVDASVRGGPSKRNRPVLRIRSWPSNLAETLAAIVALKRLKNWKGFQESTMGVVIRSDSKNMIDALKKVPTWYDSQGNYQGIGAKPTLQEECYANLHQIADNFSAKVEFQHIKAHKGDPGNLIADYLARRALEEWGPQDHWANPTEYTVEYDSGNWLSTLGDYTSITNFLSAVDAQLAPMP